ncbi:hypothetical protein D3C84_868450 [compost metagenome]
MPGLALSGWKNASRDQRDGSTCVMKSCPSSRFCQKVAEVEPGKRNEAPIIATFLRMTFSTFLYSQRYRHRFVRWVRRTPSWVRHNLEKLAEFRWVVTLYLLLGVLFSPASATEAPALGAQNHTLSASRGKPLQTVTVRPVVAYPP